MSKDMQTLANTCSTQTTIHSLYDGVLEVEPHLRDALTHVALSGGDLKQLGLQLSHTLQRPRGTTVIVNLY